jgi:hemoglobin
MSTARTASPNAQSSDAIASITEPIIRDLVHAFYAKARRDALLGPIFDANVKDWPAHLENMCAFWSSATLKSGRYKGHPMLPHARIAEIGKTHFTRWLALFGETAAEICPGEAATLFVDRAERFGQSLQVGIALHRSRTPALRPNAS